MHLWRQQLCAFPCVPGISDKHFYAYSGDAFIYLNYEDRKRNKGPVV